MQGRDQPSGWRRGTGPSHGAVTAQPLTAVHGEVGRQSFVAEVEYENQQRKSHSDHEGYTLQLSLS
jgi:hypothetical protein